MRVRIPCTDRCTVISVTSVREIALERSEYQSHVHDSHTIAYLVDCFVRHRLEGGDTRFQTDQTDRTRLFASETKALPVCKCKYHLYSLAWDCDSISRTFWPIPPKRNSLINLAKFTRARDAILRLRNRRCIRRCQSR